EGLVAVLQGAQEDVSVQVGGLGAVFAVAARDLFLDVADVRGQHAEQAEGVPLVRGEGTALIEQRRVEQGGAGEGHFQDALARGRVEDFVERDHGSVLAGVARRAKVVSAYSVHPFSFLSRRPGFTCLSRNCCLSSSTSCRLRILISS